MNRSLRPRFLKRELLLRLMLPLLAIVVATAALGTFTAQRMTERVFDRWLLDAAHSVGSVVSFEQGRAHLDLPPSAEKVLLFDDLDRTFFSVSQGERLLAGRATIPRDGTRKLVYNRGFAYLSEIDGEAVRIARVNVTNLEGPDVVILVAETLVKRQRSEQELVAVFWPMAALIVAAGAAIVVAVRRTVRPLEVIAARWNERSHVSLQPIGDDDVPRELAPFAAALNSLLARIREMLARERQFAATAAHQLRTPLAGLQLGLARAAEASDIESARLVIGELSSATQRTARLVQQLLALGRLDPEVRGELDFERCDLAALAQDVGAAHFDAALVKKIDLELIAPQESVTVDAVAELLEEALGNLLDNAIRYTPIGGRVAVEVLNSPPGVRVSDSGPGIPEAGREEMFGRFVRGVDATDEGSGLGLAIAQDIAALHGATLQLTDSLWKGVCATLIFEKRST
jgi:two-component system sensor histidine kinase TctE